MRVLVTGASGLLGRHCLAALLDGGFQVRAVVHHTPLPTELASRVEVVAGTLDDVCGRPDALDEVDAVVHCAFRLGNPGDQEFRRQHLEAPSQLLRLASARGVKIFVHVSSVVVYGFGPTSKPVTESSPAILDQPPVDAYPAAKLELEQLLEASARNLPLRLAIIRPGVLFDDKHPPVSRVTNRRGARVGLVVGSGRNHLPFIHASDVADLIARIVRNEAGGVFNAVPSQTSAALAFAQAWARGGDTRIRRIAVSSYRALAWITWFRGALTGRPIRYPNVGYGIRRATRDLHYVSGARSSRGWIDEHTQTVTEEDPRER